MGNVAATDPAVLTARGFLWAVPRSITAVSVMTVRSQTARWTVQAFGVAQSEWTSATSAAATMPALTVQGALLQNKLGTECQASTNVEYATLTHGMTAQWIALECGGDVAHSISAVYVVATTHV